MDNDSNFAPIEGEPATLGGRLMLADEIQPPTKWYEQRRREPEAVVPPADDDAMLDEALVVHMFGPLCGGE